MPARLERVNVLQIGDSHTAGDHFSGRLRELFQEKFGNAGRGMMPAGYPFPYWRPYQVEVQQRGGWTVLSSNRTDYPQLPYGLSGFITRSQHRDDTMTLQAKPEAAFDTVDIDFFRQSRGGHVVVSIDGRRVDDLDTSGPCVRAGAKVIRRQLRQLPGAAHARRRRGRYRRLGDLPARARRRAERPWLRRGGDRAAGSLELGQRHQAAARDVARLSSSWRLAPTRASARRTSWATTSRSTNRVWRSFASRCPARRSSSSGHPMPTGCPTIAACAARRARQSGCRPLGSAEAADYSQLLRSRSRSLCQWHPPAGLAIVKAAQQQAARRYGAYFWDWSSVQGGACGADRWVAQGLEHSDHVHMYEAGYQMSADKLFAELLRGYRGR